jgi:hypothetical protein
MSTPHKINTVEEQRREIVRVAHGILDGSIGIAEGARLFTSLGLPHRAEKDSDILFFKGIDGETYNIPLGDVRHLWNPEVLKVKDAELQACESRVRERAFAACKSLIARYECVA